MSVGAGPGSRNCAVTWCAGAAGAAGVLMLADADPADDADNDVVAATDDNATTAASCYHIFVGSNCRHRVRR